MRRDNILRFSYHLHEGVGVARCSSAVLRMSLLGVSACVAIGLSATAFACFGTAATTTTIAAPTTTVTEATTTSAVATDTTAEPATTTSSTEDTTTVSEVSTPTTLGRTWASLVSPGKTLADARKAPSIISASKNQPVSNVPDSLQAEFAQKFPGEEIYYIGPDNRAADPAKLEGNELSDALVTISAPGAVGARAMGYGGINGFENLKTKDFFYQHVVFKFVDIIPLSNAGDFIVHGTIPVVSDGSTNDVYVHVVRSSGSYKQTLLTCFNIGNGQFDFGDSLGGYLTGGSATSDLVLNKSKHLASSLSDDALAQFFVPGDTMRAIMKMNKPGGKPIYDGYGMPVAYLLADMRYAGADQIEALFR